MTQLINNKSPSQDYLLVSLMPRAEILHNEIKMIFWSDLINVNSTICQLTNSITFSPLLVTILNTTIWQHNVSSGCKNVFGPGSALFPNILRMRKSHFKPTLQVGSLQSVALANVNDDALRRWWFFSCVLLVIKSDFILQRRSLINYVEYCSSQMTKSSIKC